MSKIMTMEVKYKGRPMALVDMHVLDKDIRNNDLDKYHRRATLAVAIKHGFVGRPNNWTSEPYNG